MTLEFYLTAPVLTLLTALTGIATASDFWISIISSILTINGRFHFPQRLYRMHLYRGPIDTHESRKHGPCGDPRGGTLLLCHCMRCLIPRCNLYTFFIIMNIPIDARIIIINYHAIA